MSSDRSLRLLELRVRWLRDRLRLLELGERPSFPSRSDWRDLDLPREPARAPDSPCVAAAVVGAVEA